MGFLPDPLHPAVAHFPVALTFAALLFETLSCFPRWRTLAPGSLVLIVLAALGAVAGVVTGRLAAEEAVVPPAARALLEQHDTLGLLLAGGLSLLAVARAFLIRSGGRQGALGWVYVAALGLACAAMAYQGLLGGRLVYDFGVGTAPLLAAPPPGPPSLGR